MGVLQNINAVWQKIGLMQRALLAAIVLACIITGVLLTQWATRPEMRLLFGNLDIEESSRIAEKLSETNVPYQISNGGRSLFVPSDQIYTLRASLAREGLIPKSGEPGYEIFDNEKIGVSPLVQKMNYNRALQGELAKTIQVFEGIEFARVHIVRPEQTMFTTDGEKASAAVMVRVRPGWKLPQSTIAAIQNLVAGAIEGLGPDQVTIADSQGTMLSNRNKSDSIVGGANTYKDYKSAVEQEMAERLLRSLETVLGTGRVTVMTNAILDMTQETVVSTTYEKGIPLEETIDESSTVQEGVADKEGQTTLPGSTEKTGITTSKYMLPETRTTRTSVPGQITGWSVSVVADLSRPQAALPQTEGEGGAAPADNAAELLMTEEDVKQIVRTAIGPSLIKDEFLTVKHVPFTRPTAMMAQTGFGYESLERYIEIARQSSMGIMAICALLALKIFTRAGRKVAAEAAVTAGGHALGAGSMGLLPEGTGDEALAAIRRQISSQLHENPEQVRQLFATWLSEER
jgi:flagellar M-ring protein FliF